MSGAELQDVAVPRGRQADFVVGESGRCGLMLLADARWVPIVPSEAESLNASTKWLEREGQT